MLWLSLFLSSVTSSSLPFITTWNTTFPGETITLPTISAQSLVTIDWGDNSASSTIPALTNVSLSHAYVVAGLHNVSVLGEFRWISPASGNATKTKLVDIVSWGDGFLVDADSASNLFYIYSNLRVSASPFTQPVFLPGARLDYMFSGTSFDSPLNWDLTNVTHVLFMFHQTPLNKPIGFSNTQGLLDCSKMFYLASNFNQSFTMDIPNVVTVDSMFSFAASLNQPVTLTNSQKVRSTVSMFASASSFNQPFNLDTQAVLLMTSMFSGAVKFNQPLTFDTSIATNMVTMFYGASSFNQTLNFSTAKVTTMNQMFYNAAQFEQDLASWNTSSVTACSQFCARCGLPAFPRCSNPCSGTKYTNERNMSVCYSLAPTAPTTSRPTSAPSTPYPTRSPTSRPTSAPSTPAPTSQPTTHAPSRTPSSSPTHQPTTLAPTLAPSSAAPSRAPSTAPTSQPTSHAPSAAPSTSPTSQPTSHAPSSASSMSPTSQPSSHAPSSAPTSTPTSQPTSHAPTLSPSSAAPSPVDPSTVVAPAEKPSVGTGLLGLIAVVWLL